jgi:hypothetical protein
MLCFLLRSGDGTGDIHLAQMLLHRSAIDALAGNTATITHLGADGAVYASGSGSSENQESAMNRRVPDEHITSPPQSVSIPRPRLQPIALTYPCHALSFFSESAAQLSPQENSRGIYCSLWPQMTIQLVVLWNSSHISPALRLLHAAVEAKLTR